MNILNKIKSKNKDLQTNQQSTQRQSQSTNKNVRQMHFQSVKGLNNDFDVKEQLSNQENSREYLGKNESQQDKEIKSRNKILGKLAFKKVNENNREMNDLNKKGNLKIDKNLTNGFTEANYQQKNEESCHNIIENQQQKIESLRKLVNSCKTDENNSKKYISPKLQQKQSWASYQTDFSDSFHNQDNCSDIINSDEQDQFFQIKPKQNVQKLVELTRNYKTLPSTKDQNLQTKKQSLEKEKQEANYHQKQSFTQITKQIPKQYNFLLLVRKGYQIGKMSIFEGFLEKKQLNKELNMNVRTRLSETSLISCKTEVIPNPESISHIFMKKIMEVGENEYLISDREIIKVLEKSANRR